MRRRHAQQIRLGIRLAQIARDAIRVGNSKGGLELYGNVVYDSRAPRLTKRAFVRTYDRSEYRAVYGRPWWA